MQQWLPLAWPSQRNNIAAPLLKTASPNLCCACLDLLNWFSALSQGAAFYIWFYIVPHSVLSSFTKNPSRCYFCLFSILFTGTSFWTNITNRTAKLTLLLFLWEKKSLKKLRKPVLHDIPKAALYCIHSTRFYKIYLYFFLHSFT